MSAMDKTHGPLVSSKAEQGTEEWHAARYGYMTASNASKILTDTGKPRTGKMVETMAIELAGEVLYQQSMSPFTGSYATEHGHEQEPLAREAYELLTLNSVVVPGFHHRTKHVGCSTDGLVGEPGMIEIKSPQPLNAVRHRKYVRETGTAPGEYLAQIHFSLWVMDREWCDFILWAAHSELDERLCVARIERSAEWDAACEQAALGVLAMRDEIIAAEMPSTEQTTEKAA